MTEIEALKRLQVETGSLACLGCGHEHKCGIHGCAIIRRAVELLEADEAKLIDQADKISAQAGTIRGLEDANDAMYRDLQVRSRQVEEYQQAIINSVGFKKVYKQLIEMLLEQQREGVID